MFYKSYAKSDARAFDHLYDPLYTTGNYRDIQKENAIALTKTAPVNIYTNFNSMFADSPQRPSSFIVLQRNQLPRTPEINGSHQKRDNHYASGRNRAKFFNASLVNATKSAPMAQLAEQSPINENTATKPRTKSRSVACQTLFREQSAQTKPYLPQIHYHPGIEKTELFQVDDTIDLPAGLGEIRAINRRRKRLECEKVLNQYNGVDEICQVFETLEWEEWLNRENEIEDAQSERFHMVEEMLKQRDKLFEIDSIKTIDHSVNRLNNEHKLKIENINKRYERSIRKLRKFVYNHTKGEDQSNLTDAIQKMRRGNLNNLITAASRKYDTALSRIEKVGSFTVNYESAMHTKIAIDKPKKAVCEIEPGFLKDNNLRVVYEALKVYRLQQTIHDEISNQLKSIDKFRTATDDRSQTKIDECKHKIAEMLKMHSYLKELLQSVQQISIDSYLDLLIHKFNIIRTEGSIIELLNIEAPKMSPLMAEACDPFDFSSVYLNDILRRCNELKRNSSSASDATEKVITNEVVRDVVWPEIMDRLDNYLDHRKQIKVDLKRLTTEEEAMVESIRNECVENIMDGLFRKKMKDE